MYIKPVLLKYGSFRELTRWGFASASDGGSILGIGSSVGCETDLSRWGLGSYSIGCPTGPTSS